jgi:hypothetical protein
MALHTILRKNFQSLMCVVVCIFLSGCVSICRYDGPYEGKVIDLDTNQPIEGAVVHADWSKLHSTAGGASSEYYDSYEILTDKNGVFKIPGKGLLILTNIDDMSLSIFKAGYEQYPDNSSWVFLKKSGSFGRVSWDGDKGTFRLRKRTMEERRENTPNLPSTPSNKQRKLYIIERNKEMTEIGFPASTLLPEE